MKIAVDFDGTCVDHIYPAVGMDVPLAAATLGDLIEAGHDIILYTMRSGDLLVDAINWFSRRGIVPVWGPDGPESEYMDDQQ